MPYNSAGTFRAGTLADVTYRVARELSAVREGVATTGTATAIADTVNLTQADDFFVGGGAWILRDAAEAGAVPEGEMGQVTDFVNSSAVLTVAAVSGSSDPFSAAVLAGDRYAVTTSKYPPQQIIAEVNAALLRMGSIEKTDRTSVDTASPQTEFGIPAAVSRDLRKVQIQGRTGDSDDTRPKTIENWDIERTAAGTSDLLMFPFQYTGSRDVYLTYMQEHSELDDPSDAIDESVDINLLVAETAVALLQWRDAGTGNDPNIQRQLDRWLKPGPEGVSELARLRGEGKQEKEPLQPKYLTMGTRRPRDRFTYPGPA